ncbi:hypothetical protein CHS0354_009153 [Potamilus streckersoni]|uniref:Uncharacterized protein n=1 Tax=Potamilus streckersoni TaxID=2493646 RepID=A0AAE0W0V6_9BIVA|nr:hypothetical protein CHS0354_009153 [Potamilus streckersoni]
MSDPNLLTSSSVKIPYITRIESVTDSVSSDSTDLEVEAHSGHSCYAAVPGQNVFIEVNSGRLCTKRAVPFGTTYACCGSYFILICHAVAHNYIELDTVGSGKKKGHIGCRWS